MKSAFRKIVIGVDFSDASLAGARWVANHLAPQAELYVVHVLPIPSAPAYLREYVESTTQQRMNAADHLYTALRGFAGLLGAPRVRVGIRTGVPWTELARVAHEVKADLICVGRGHKRQGSSRFGATTPQRMLAIAKVPVLVIPQAFVTRPVRVLAALSACDGEERVTAVAHALASTWASRLETVHVVETDVDEEPLRALASDWLASIANPTGDEKLYTRIVRFGDAGQELIASARGEASAAAIVVGRARAANPTRSSSNAYHCGSTTRMVLWSAPGPVFVLPLEAQVDLVLPSRAAASPDAWLPSDARMSYSVL